MFEPLHPAVVHVPMGLAVVIPLLAIGLTVALWREWLPRKAWLAVVLFQMLLLGSGILAMNTGEADEETVESVVAEAAIEEHEEAAEVFLWGAGLTLAAMVGVLFLKPPMARRAGMIVAAAGTLAVAGLGVHVGHEGGMLVYEHGAAQAHIQRAASGEPAQLVLTEEHDEHEEE